MQVNRLITLALKQLGVLAVGETATADDLVDGLDGLNNLLSQWATSKLYVYHAMPTIINLDGTGRYHLSASGVSDNATLDGVAVRLIRDTNIHPNEIAYTVGADGVTINTNKQGKLSLTAHVLPHELGVNDSLVVPTYYKRALILALALEIAPMYGVAITAELMRNHANAIMLLKRANSTPFLAKNDLPVGVGGGCGCGGLFGG